MLILRSISPYSFMALVFTLRSFFTYLCVAAVPGSLGSVREVDIPKHELGLKRTWDQKLSSGLLLTFIPVQPVLVQLRGCWSILTTKQDNWVVN